jgi:hypothetical protein
MLTVFSVIRNGVRNGYPFVEAYGSWLRHADRILILEGGSTDGTQHVLNELAQVDNRITWLAHPWPSSGAGGSAIADFTNEALRIARRGATRLMYVQADEIYTPSQREFVRSQQDGTFEFAGCINFWNSLDTVVADDFPLTYVRSFSARTDARSKDDGFTFDIHGTRVTRINERILHFGWCFPVNILQKHVNHAAMYPDKPAYVNRGKFAQLMLDRKVYDRRLLDALLPDYQPTPFQGELPACMHHLIDQEIYDPYLGLGLLRSGTRW